MKKITIILLFVACLLLTPQTSVKGITMEVVTTIKSFTIPERSIVLNLPNKPNTEFSICAYARIFIADKNNSYAAKGTLIRYPGDTSSGCLEKNRYAIISLDYNSALAPYKVYIELRSYKQYENDTDFKANCTPQTLTAGGVAGYYHGGYLNYASGLGNYTNATCPNFYCKTSYCDSSSSVMVFNHDSVIGYNNANTIICGSTATSCSNIGTDTGVTNYYWRSPFIFTVN